MPPSQKRAQSMVEERQRIDATLATLDAAKAKALAQRAEYGRFLEWKVKMQHRERKQRAEEERNLRARIDAKLKTVLTEHRERKREEVDRWKEFASQPAPKRVETAVQRAAREEAEEEERRQTRRRQLQREAFTSRSSPVNGRRSPHSAPSSVHRKRLNQPGYQPTVSQGGTAPRITEQPQRSAMKRRHNGASSIEGGAAEDDLDGGDDGTLPHRMRFANEAEFRAAHPLPDIPTTRAPAAGGADADLDALSPAQLATLKDVHAKRRHTARVSAVVASMYQTAKSRYLYSTKRTLADPPADYLMGVDVMRYLPADVLNDVDATAAGSRPPAAGGVGERSTVFLTEQHSANQAGSAPLLVTSAAGEDDAENGTGTDPVEREHSGLPAGMAGSSLRPRGPRMSRWKPFDPFAWVSTGAGRPKPSQVPLSEPPPRVKEEEEATLLWYKECYEPTTKIKRRTDAGADHTWKRIGQHRLPPLGSTKY